MFQLFWSFFKIGTFTIGGGYAMIPLMEKELVDRRQWMSHEEFLDLMAVSQALPGIFAVNMATAVGYRRFKLGGAVMAVLGNVSVPILIILGIAVFFRHFSDNRIVESIFKGMRPAVVALIAAPVFTMAKSARISWRNFWIPLAAALLIWLLGISPVLVILAAGIGGFIYGKLRRKEEKP